MVNCRRSMHESRASGLPTSLRQLMVGCIPKVTSNNFKKLAGIVSRILRGGVGTISL